MERLKRCLVLRCLRCSVDRIGLHKCVGPLLPPRTGLALHAMTVWVNILHWIIERVGIGIVALTHTVRRQPPAGGRVVEACPEVVEARAVLLLFLPAEL